MQKSCRLVLFVLLSLLVTPLAPGQELKTVPLPKPQTTGGKPLMQALSERKTTRSFSEEKLSPQILSDLLWAADGINRPDGRRTAPSPMNVQEIDIYVVTAEGTYLYNARGHALQPVAAGDLRALAGTQGFVAKAPLNLVYVADFARMGAIPAPEKTIYSAASTGFIGQNVYLFCASEGLAVVVRASVEHSALAKALKLRPEQHIVLAQTVGHPGK
jgi:nitroreductase